MKCVREIYRQQGILKACPHCGAIEWEKLAKHRREHPELYPAARTPTQTDERGDDE